MATQTYTPKPFMNLREAIEGAVKIARATGDTVIINMNNVHFSVEADTKIQTAIDAYLEVKNKMFETTQQSNQK